MWGTREFFVKKMSYDQSFLYNVLQVFEDYKEAEEVLPDFVKEWYRKIASYCRTELDVFFRPLSDQELNENEFYDTLPGDMVSCMIWQYRFDQLFQNDITNKLGELCDQREDVMRNHPRYRVPHYHIPPPQDQTQNPPQNHSN